MAIVGSRFTAVWIENHQWNGATHDRTTTIYYHYLITSQAEIEDLYPTLAADTDVWVPMHIANIRMWFLGQNSPSGPSSPYYDAAGQYYDDILGDSAAMLDPTQIAPPTGTIGGAYVMGLNNTSGHIFEWDADALDWITGGANNAEGDPEAVIPALYPDRNTYAEQTVAPFGPHIGTVKFQLATWYDEGLLPDFAYRQDLLTAPPPAGWRQIPFGVSTHSGTSLVYIFTPAETETVPEDPPVEVGDVDEAVKLRVWPFSLDGHDYYVLRVGQNETLVYDLTTGQWAEWQSPALDNWRVHVGQNWVGMSADTFAHALGTDVVAGDDTYGVLYTLDPASGQDDDPVTGGPFPFDRMVMGGIPLDGREVAKCNAVTLNLSLGSPASLDADITLETSDDMGQTWADHGTQTITAGDYGAVVEWRSLGLMRAPGRVFRITDQGAAVRISAADLR